MAGTELAKAYVQIIPSADGIKGKLTNALSGEASEAGDSAGKVAGTNLASAIKKAIAAAGIGVALKKAISEGANLQQSLGGIETLFKDSADKVIKNAQNAYMTAGLSANEYMESVTSFSASLLQGLAGDTNKAADVADMALTDMADNANKMGTSMESIQNAYQGFAKQNYTMLDNLKLGYGGTKTEMQRLLADATKLTGVKYDLNNLSDVYEAIHVIQEDLGITGTTAKEAASTISGSMASMKAALSNVFGNLALGEDIGPSLEALGDTVFTFVKDNLFPMVGNLLSGLPEVVESVLGMAIRSLNIISNNADVFIENGIALVSELGMGIISALPYLAEAAFNVVTSLGEAIINTDWIAVAKNIISTLKDNLDLAAGEIFGADEGVVDAFFAGINEAFAAMWDVCNTVWVSIGQPIWDAITFVVQSLADLFAQNMPAIMGFFQEAIAGIMDTWENHLKPTFEAIGAFLNDVIRPVFEYVFVNCVLPYIQTVFQHIVNIWNGTLKPAFDAICDFLTGVFTGNWQQMKDSLLTIINALREGVKTTFTSIKTLMSTIWNNIKTDVTNTFNNIKATIQTKIQAAKDNLFYVFDSIKSGIKSKIESARDVVKNAIDRIKGFFKFEWSLPHLKMPHPTISGSFSLNPPSVPSFGIEWYAKAMNDPIIMNSPTAFGINSLGQIMAGGERGSEVVSGTETLMRMIASAVASQNGVVADSVNNGFARLMALLVQYFPQFANMQLVTDTGALIGELAPGMDEALGKIATMNERGIW